MPRTAAKVDDFRAILPAGTRVYLAHIDGTDFAEMLATARRLVDEGFAVMPHFPARGIASRAELAARIAAYADVGVRRALVIAGGIDTPRGEYHEALQLLRTGLFDRAGFTELHVAGHPEGNRDIDPAGGDAACMAALARQGRLPARDRRGDGDRHAVLPSRPGRSSSGPTGCAPPASPCRSTSASPARPSSRPC